MWDQLLVQFIKIRLDRIIPTYVGSTLRLIVPLPYLPNHSHVCGINILISLDDSRVCESFPRMWDQRNIHILHFLRVRIIPTYVGSTARRAVFALKDPNHSHVCGINVMLSTLTSP